MPIHQAFIDEKAYLATIGKELDEGNGTKDVHKDVHKEISERQLVILDMIKRNVQIKREEMSTILKVNEKTIRRDLSDLQEKNLIRREGGRKEGRWVIINNKE